MPALEALFVADAPEMWERLGFTVTDNRVRLGRVVVVLTGATSDRGIRGWSVAGIDDTIDGLTSVPAPEIANGFNDHHNAVFRLDRVTIQTNDLDRTTAAFEVAGLQQRPGVFWAGRSIIELETPVEGAGTPAGVASFGRLTLGCDDFERTAGLLGSLLSPPREAPQEGQVLGTISAEAGLSVRIDIISPPPNFGIEQFAAEARAGD